LSDNIQLDRNKRLLYGNQLSRSCVWYV